MNDQTQKISGQLAVMNKIDLYVKEGSINNLLDLLNEVKFNHFSFPAKLLVKRIVLGLGKIRARGQKQQKEKIANFLIKFLDPKHYGPSYRLLALKSLSKGGVAGYEEQLETILKDQDEEVRLLAADYLLKSGYSLERINQLSSAPFQVELKLG